MQAESMKHSNYLARKYPASMETGESLDRPGLCREARFHISWSVCGPAELMIVIIIRRAGLLATVFALLSLQFALVSHVTPAEAPTVDYFADNTYSGTIYYRIVP